MSEPTKYRLARAHGLVAVGVGLVCLAIAVVLWMLLSASDIGRVIGLILIVAAGLGVVAAVGITIVRPVVAVIDDRGFSGRVRTGSVATTVRSPKNISWSEVSEVDTHDGVVELRATEGDPVLFPLSLVDAAVRVPLMRDIHDRLNEAHGYRPL